MFAPEKPTQLWMPHSGFDDPQVGSERSEIVTFSILFPRFRGGFGTAFTKFKSSLID